MLGITILIIILVISLSPAPKAGAFSEKSTSSQGSLEPQGQTRAILLNRSIALVLVFSAVLSANCYQPLVNMDIGSGVGIYNSLWQISILNVGAATFIYIACGLVLLLGEGITHKLPFEYPLIALLTTLGMTALLSSYDLISFFLAIELQSLSLYIMATMFRESESATSAGLKYFLLGSLSSGFILLGSSILYGLTGLTNFEAFSAASQIVGNPIVDGVTQNGVQDQLSYLVLPILAIGLLFKIASAPFHNWAPDVYDGVPTLVTSWIAILPKISIFVFLIEFNFTFGGDALASIFLFSAFLSLLIGSIMGLSQYRIKRLLAYSSISHVGFLLLSLAGCYRSDVGSLIFYLIQYSLTSINVFFILIAFGLLSRGAHATESSLMLSPIQTLSQLRAQFKNNPLCGLSLAICLFSMAGIPPCIGFFGKLFIFESAIANGYYFMVFIMIIASIIGAVYYLKVIKIIHFYEKPNYAEKAISQDLGQYPPHRRWAGGNLAEIAVPWTSAFIIAVISLALIFFILNPIPILNFVHLVSLGV